MIGTIIKQTLPLLVFLYGIVPLVVKFYPQILNHVVFLHAVAWPPFQNLSDLQAYDLPPTRNFQIETDDDVICGVWHILPKSVIENSPELEESNYDQTLSASQRPVVLYLHGNSGTRGSSHRVALYNILSSLDFHIITIDYRGYADSSGHPTEEGVVKDALTTYNWIKKHNNKIPVIVWGHSLGTAIATAISATLSKSENVPAALILESPFNNMADAATYHPFSVIYRYTPLFESIFLQSLKRADLHLATDQKILDVTCPVLILHARDDEIVPFALGEKLYKVADKNNQKNHPKKLIKFISFNEPYGHKHIHKAENLKDIIKDFTGHF